MFNCILVVCTGNICRSPVAEAMLKTHFPDRQIQSAGLNALVGERVDSCMSSLAKADGLEVENHKARQLTVSMLQWAELVLVMTDDQRYSVASLYPASAGKTKLFGCWLRSMDSHRMGENIPDPYRKSPEFSKEAYKKLKAAADAWAARLN